MSRALQAKRHSLQTWPDSTRWSYPPVPITGGAPILTLTPGVTSMGVGISVEPPTGLSVVAYEVQRLIASVWTTVSVTRPGVASEVPAQITSAPNKWCHPSGTLDGHSAYTTIQAALSSLVAGDHLVIGGATYNEWVKLTSSGTLSAPIIVRCHDYNNRPIIDGNFTNPPGWSASGFQSGSTALFSVAGSNVIIDGINLVESNENGWICGPADNNGNFLANPATWFSNVKVIRCSSIGSDGAAFKTHNVDGLQVLGCTFLDAERGVYEADGTIANWGSCVMAMGKNMLFAECTIGQTSGEGIHAGYHGAWGGGDGYAHIQAENLVVRNCRIFDCWSAPIYITNVDGGVFERNIVYHTADTRYWYSAASGYPQYGIDIGSESGVTGVRGTNAFTGARNVLIANNIVTGALFPFRFQDWASQQTTNVKVMNNTFYATTPGSAASVASLVKNSESELTNIYFWNNLVYEATAAQMCREWLTPGGTWSRGTNLFSTTPPTALAGSGDVISSSPGLTDATYRPAGSYPSVNAFDPSKLEISASSPAVNVGTLLSEVVVDFYGRTRPRESGKLDIGAISRSLETDISYTESGLPAATAQSYRVRAQWSSLAYSDYSAVGTATTGASGGGATAPSFDQAQQASTNTSGTGTTAKQLALDLNGLDPNDLIIVGAVHLNGDTAGNSDGTGFNVLNAPSGYHLLGASPAGAGDWSKAWAWFRIAGASEPDPVLEADASQSSYRLTAQALVYKSNVSGFPIDYTVGSSGTATGGSTTTLVDTGASWTTDQWKDHLLWNSATSQFAMIASNTATTLTLRTALATAVASGNAYEIRALKFALQRNASSSSNVQAPSLTPTMQPHRLVNMFLGTDGNSTVGADTLTVPGSMSKRGEVKDNNTWSFVAGADEARTVTTATGTRTATFASAAPESWGLSLIVRGG